VTDPHRTPRARGPAFPGRRGLLLAAAGMAVGPALAQSDGFPNRPVRMLVPFPPAGAADIVARVVAEAVPPHLGQTVIVENRSGGGGSIGTEAAIRAVADGYTLLMGNLSTNSINPEIRSNLGYEPATGLTPVAAVGNVYMVLYARPDLPARSMAELIALAKARPGELTYGTAGVGSSTHLATLLLETSAGIRLNHIPFRGTAPATAAVLGSQVDFTVDTVPTSIPHISGGKVRAMGITSRARHALMPDVPSFIELGIMEHEIAIYNVIFAPAQTPPAILDRLASAFEATVALPAVKARLAEIGVDQMAVPRATLAAYIAADRARWGAVIRRAGISLD